MTEECPHCGSPGYQNVGEGTPRICVECGYDDEHGALSVCPGGKHPRDSARPCCDACWARAPRDLPGWPRWRSYRVGARTKARRGYPYAARMVVAVDDALTAWLADHPAE